MSGARQPCARVLLLTENAPVPSDRRVWNESRALTAAGYEVVIISAQGDGRCTKPFEVLECIEIHRYPLRQAGAGVLGYVREYAEAMLRTRLLIRRLSRDRHFDVVHASNPPDFLLLSALSLRRRGARLIFDHHDLMPELCLARFGDRAMLHGLARMAEWIGFRLADVVICTNESYRQIALERGHCRPENVFVVRNGPDVSHFVPVEPDPSLKQGRTHLISYLGVMAKQDGVDHAVRALAQLRERRDDWRAIFMGEGECLEEMRALVRELGLDDIVEFPGWKHDAEVRLVLSSSDVCLVPDPPNPLNELSTLVKVVEYMAIGRPIVSYNLRESRFSAGEAAIYAHPGDVASFAACIDELLSNPARRAHMGEVGRRRVEARLAWEHSARTLRAAYRHALGAHLELALDESADGRLGPPVTLAPERAG